MRAHLESYLSSLTEDRDPVSKKTVQCYSHKLNLFLTWLGERVPTRALLNEYKLHRQREGKRPRTIRVDFTAVFSFFEWLEAQGLATALPARGCISLPRLDEAQRETPTDSEVDRMFAAVRAMPSHRPYLRFVRARAHAVLALFAYAGLRRAELLALELRDLDRESNPWRVYIRVGKGAQSGWVYLNEEAQEILAEWIAIRGDWCRKHQATTEGLFPVDRRRNLSGRGLDNLWADIQAMAGLQERHLLPHGMRHWYGSRIEEAEGLATAQKCLRHKNPDTTLGYLKTNTDKMKRAAASLSRSRPTEEAEVPPPPRDQPPRRQRIDRRRRPQ